MNCPVCSRVLAPTLSICPSCGAMMNDTVREECEANLTSGKLAKPATPPVVNTPPVSVAAAAPTPAVPAAEAKLPAPMLGRGPTTELSPSKTSPTLVGFQQKKPAIPEWRIQMQNAARQRLGGSVETAPAPRPALRSNGAAALKAQPVAKAEAVSLPEDADPRLAAALDRINRSRSSFAPAKPAQAASPAARPVAAERNLPFSVVSKQPSSTPRAAVAAAPAPKPVLTAVPQKVDTNKLPAISEIVADTVDSFRATRAAELPEEPAASPSQKLEFDKIKRIVINAAPESDSIHQTETDAEEIEDLAPFAMRFNAGLFDLIIGMVCTMVVLSPFALSGGSWASLAGLATFAGALAVVMFLYLTGCVAFVGKTLGMRLFSLEIVDVEENEYPTLHQAAVSSAVYLLSLLFAGAGFITVFFNEEKRAAHDLLSGTIVVREF